VVLSSPVRRAASHAVSRRLDFEEDTSLQESPALRGSGQARGKRTDVYDIEQSPGRAISAVLDESFVQDEITAHETVANEDSAMNGFAEESFTGDVGDDIVTGATVLDNSVDVTEGQTVEEEEDTLPEPEPEPEVVAKQQQKRGRKRKSEALASAVEGEQAAPKSKKQASATKKDKKAPASAPRRKSNRNFDVEEGPSTAMDESMDVSEQVEEPVEESVAVPKRRGRPPKVQPKPEKVHPALIATVKSKLKASAPKRPEPAAFKKPEVPAAKKAKVAPKPKPKAFSNTDDRQTSPQDKNAGKLIDNLGNPLSRADVDKMSTTSTGSKYGRGRQLLSVYRELEPDEVARVGKTGRHRVAPVDFWKNERLAYNYNNDLEAIVRNETQEPERAKRNKQKGRKRALTAVVEEDEDDLEEWERTAGVVVGEFRDFDPVTEVTSADLLEDSMYLLL
jgi:centromere protein C